MKEPKVGIIIQTRMGSTRLPGKVLKSIDNNDTVLGLLIKRLKLSKSLDEIIIATTPDERNLAIIELVRALGVSYFVGSEENVLERYYEAAIKFNIEIVIRITSDCPFIDPFILDEMVDFFKNHDYDFVRNRDIPDSTNFPLGMDIEIFTFDVLKKVYFVATSRPAKEHVTYYIVRHEDEFKIYYFDIENLKKFKGLRLTIDEEADLKMCRELYRKLKEKGKKIDFTIHDIIDVIDKNPEIMNININVQKKNP